LQSEAVHEVLDRKFSMSCDIVVTSKPVAKVKGHRAQQPGNSVSESVAAALEGRVRLQVFDNCEQVRDAAADLVEAILAHSATVTILATSREGLGVADEQLWLVPSLDVGAGIDSTAPAGRSRGRVLRSTPGRAT
jgi:hypothetical protein